MTTRGGPAGLLDVTDAFLRAFYEADGPDHAVGSGVVGNGTVQR